MDLSRLAKDLWPHLEKRIGNLVVTPAAASSGGSVPSPHDLDGVHHTGTLDSTQAPQFLLMDGSRNLTGNLTVTAGVTIDGVDISGLEAAYNLHAGGTAYAKHTGGLGTHTHQSVGAEGGKLDHGLALDGLGDDDHTQYLKEEASGGTAAETPDHTHQNAATCGKLDHGLALDGLGDDDHTIYAITPGTLTVATTNQRSSAGAHYHAITSSASPGAAASLLASDANGYLQLVRLGAGVAPSVPLHALAVTEQMRLAYDVSNYASFTVGSGGNLTLAPTGDLVLDPTGNDVLPATGYDLNIGSLSKKYLTLHAAELWVETLVAQNTIATIGGRILVGPTNVLTADLSGTNMVQNPGFETAGAGGADVFLNWSESAGDGAITQNGVEYRSGSYSCKIVTGAGTNSYVSQSIAVTATHTYTLSFWTFGDTVAFGRYWVYDIQHGTYLIPLTSVGSKAGGWTRTHTTFDVPAGCTSVTLLFRCTDTNTSYFYVDDVSLHDSTIEVKYNDFAAGDILVAEAGGYIEFMEVLAADVGVVVRPTGYDHIEHVDDSGESVWRWEEVEGITTTYLCTVKRDLDGTGSNDWYAGDALFNTGAAGDGFIDLYSVHGLHEATNYGPTIVGNVRNSATYNDWTEHWAIGNLNGVYGYGTNLYGFAAGKYSTTTSWLAADATNGIRIMRGSTQLAQWDISGNILIGQAAANQDNLYLASGGVQLRTNTTVHVDLQADGDVLIGENTAAAATTNLAIFTAAQTYNSEVVSAGDFLIGDNSAGKANVFWDKSAGKLQFRGGTTMQLEIATDGTLTAGPVDLDSNGIIINVGTAFDDTKAYRFLSGADIIGTLKAYCDHDVTHTSVVSLIARDASYQNTLGIYAYGHAAGSVTIGAGHTGTPDVVDNTLVVYTTYSAFSDNVFLNESENANMTLGLTLNQGANTNEILALKSSTVAHGITDLTETDTYGSIKLCSSTAGGLWIDGISEATLGLGLRGVGVTDNTTKSTSGAGYVELRAAKKNGTAMAVAGSDANLVVIRNLTTTRFIFDAEGSAHADVEWTTFDEHDDLALLDVVEQTMLAQRDPVKREFSAWLDDNKTQLEQLGLVHFDRENPGHAMVNTTKMMMLMVGALRQANQRIHLLEGGLN
ncbi:MAG: hypothetical protein WC869_10385 [Phycisphaerae bacterium]|jgi:hypothetical protein